MVGVERTADLAYVASLVRFEFVALARAPELLRPRLARRVAACVRARGRGGVYLENGHARTGPAGG